MQVPRTVKCYQSAYRVLAVEGQGADAGPAHGLPTDKGRNLGSLSLHGKQAALDRVEESWEHGADLQQRVWKKVDMTCGSQLWKKSASCGSSC